MEINDGDMRAGGITMDFLARNLGRRAGRVVFDRTGIDGYFDLTLKTTREPDPNRPDAPSIFTALQEQLGLKLQSERVATEFMVIDHVERPTDD